MVETLTYLGVACIIAAIVGGGLKILGYDIPVIGSLPRQILLGIFGLLLIGSVRIEVIRKYLAEIWPGKYEFNRETVRPNSWVSQGIKSDVGIIYVRVKTVSPDFHPDGKGARYEPRVIICPPNSTDVMKCPWGQVAAGGMFQHKAETPGAYSVFIYNYAVNPPLEVTAEVLYPW